MLNIMKLMSFCLTMFLKNRIFSQYSIKNRIRCCSCLIAVLLLLPGSGSCLTFNNIVDSVGSAVKSGAKSIEKGVKQVLPGDEKKAGDKKNAEQKQPSGNEASVPAENNAAAENKTIDTPNPKTGGAVATQESQEKSIFSKNPIDPQAPPPATASFQAGDQIYGMLKAAKPWKDLVGSSDYLIVDLYIDGKKKIGETIGLKRAELLARDYFIIDIAPTAEGMSNYSDRDIIFHERDGYRFGPELFTRYLSEFSAGSHTFRLVVSAYNKVFASGEFSISGDDYSFYATLLTDLKNSGDKQQKMPIPGMVDLALQAEMIGLLKNAGWPDIRRILIVDKDWWIDRVAGGDSAVASRHIQAAAAARDGDGSYYFQKVTFHQPMLITGNWGKMEISDTGKKTEILEENIDK